MTSKLFTLLGAIGIAACSRDAGVVREPVGGSSTQARPTAAVADVTSRAGETLEQRAAHDQSPSPHSEALPVFVRKSERSDLELEALAQGRLHIDGNGCLRIGGEKGAFVIWHHDSRIERTSDGRIRITDGYSGNTAYVGDEIAMGGGRENRVPPATGERAETPTNVTEPIPEACASGEIWWAGRLMTETERQRRLNR